MNVPSKSDDPGRRSRAGVAMVLLWLVAAAAQAVDFDERLQAPRVANPGELHSQALSYAERFN